MSTAESRWISPEEYLAREQGASFKSEYWNGEVFAMAGASLEHTMIKDNLAGQTNSQLRGGPCRALTSDVRVKVHSTGLYTYPDIAIVCENIEMEDQTFDTLLNPRAIVEVLSDATEKYDRGAKFSHYRRIPSLEENVLVSQDRPLVERFVRQPDGTWTLTVFDRPDQMFDFASVPARVPLAAIYEGVNFSAPRNRRRQPPSAPG